jgi:hypothetical protein
MPPLQDVCGIVAPCHDDDLAAAPAEIDLIIDGVRARRPTLTHDRVDATHSKASEA